MKGRILRLLLSTNPSKSFSYMPQVSILMKSSATAPLPQLGNNYSSVPRTPLGEERKDDQSEEFFLRNLNFGGGDGDEKVKLSELRFPASGSGRPMRGERRADAADDGSGKISEARRKPPGRIPDRSMRGERREGGPVHQKFDFGGEGFGENLELHRQSSRTSRTQAVDGPSRGEERDDISRDFSAQSREHGDQSESFRKQEGSDQSETSFINKLKFSDAARDNTKDKAQQEPSAKVPADEPSLSESSVQDADEIFKKMKETGLIPNAVAMLDGLCKDGLVQEAMKLFGLMREKGTIPEVVIYTAVVEGFCKAAKFDDAKRIFRKMQNNGIVPNAFSYTVLIRGLCKGKKWEDCVDFCLEMLQAGHLPNVVTFTGLVEGLCKEKGVEEAERVIRTLRKGGLSVDERAVKEHLDKKGPFSPLVREAIFGKKDSGMPF